MDTGMDAVYMVRPGPVEELRFSLRSLAANVSHERVWIFGSAPSWVDRNAVRVVPSPKLGTKYATTTGHVRVMCRHPEVSDPFVLWMDDVYAVAPIGEMPRLHLGPLDARLQRFSSLRSTWASGMRATAALLAERFPDRELLSYEHHAPLIVHKAAMLEALDVADGMRIPAPHKRTLYGNIAELGGIRLRADPKWVSWAVDPPKGQWLSSDDASFRTLTRPVLRWLFPDACPYEAISGRRTRTAGDSARQTALASQRAASPRTRPVPGAVQAYEQRRATLQRRKEQAEAARATR